MEDATIVDYDIAVSRDVSKSKQARFLRRRFHTTPAIRSEWRAEETSGRKTTFGGIKDGGPLQLLVLPSVPSRGCS